MNHNILSFKIIKEKNQSFQHISNILKHKSVYFFIFYYLQINFICFFQMAQIDFTQKINLKDNKKHMEWGVSQPYIQKKIITQINKYYDHDKNEQLFKDRKMPSNIGEQYKQYKTQYSQVSAIETGFKKLKSNQIEILKELKKEYEVLRNSSLDNRIYYQKKNMDSQSNGYQKSGSNSEALSSIKSKRSLTKLSDRRELKAVTMQNKQLQMMLNNSMKKIQDLLHNQIELKNTIFALKNRQQQRKWSQTETQTALKRSKDSQQNLKKHLKQLQRQNQHLKSTIKQYILKNGNLQGSLQVKELQFKKFQDKVKLMQEQLKLQKNRYLSLELDLKKLHAEYDLLQKIKNQELMYYKKSKNVQEDALITQKQNIIKRLQEQLAIKQERYILLLNKLNNTPSQSIPQPPSKPSQSSSQQHQSHKIYQQILSIMKQDRNKQNDQGYRSIIQKLNQIDKKPDNQLISQINFLKNQLEAIKNNNIKHQNKTQKYNQSELYRAEQKIRQLQKIIDEENVEKMYFMQDVQKITRDYASLKKEKEKIEKELRDFQYLIQKLQSQNQNYKEEIHRIKNTNMDLTQSQHQNQTLIKKIQYYNLKESELNNAKDELNRKLQSFKTQQGQYEEEVRLLKRQLNDEEFKVFKSTEESQLKIKLLKTQSQAAIAKSQEQLQRTKKAYALQKADLVNQRIQWQKKHFLKNEQFETLLKELNNSTRARDIAVSKKVEQYQSILRFQRQNFVKQMTGMVSKVQSLTQINERLLKQSNQYMQIEAQILQLKKVIRNNRRLTESVDHLWSVKEVEYNNINDVLELIKQH